ncbi:uncharacterized protein LOC105847521 isoform X2 [Hydra vulgaris]|uniref:Uncharacterized protein LOC105847521 isoform X2 n=1 Tax=Hydra vulgaris TaxID=6087 RepID=A0ABM4C5T3_HYDVU
MQNIFLIVNLGCLVINLTFATNISEYGKNDLCQLPTVKQLLSKLRMSSDSSQCILKQNQDIEYLVTSFIENIFNTPVKKEVENERVSTLNDKIGNYCCSPVCDKFMSRLGNPISDLIRCT